MFSSKLHRLLVSKFQYQFLVPAQPLKALAYWKCCFSSSLKTIQPPMGLPNLTPNAMHKNRRCYEQPNTFRGARLLFVETSKLMNCLYKAP